ncbi:hypothetical protein BF49_6311 [Bradyrhizobium sp.]|nr:hypothetical protein BF49_6311 [Bradyrhizobium sp.]
MTAKAFRNGPAYGPQEAGNRSLELILFGHTCVGNSLSISKRPKMGKSGPQNRQFCHTHPGICGIGPDFRAADGCSGGPNWL